MFVIDTYHLNNRAANEANILKPIYQDSLYDGLFIKKTLQWLKMVLQKDDGAAEKRVDTKAVLEEYMLVYRSSEKNKQEIKSVNRKRRSDSTMLINNPTTTTRSKNGTTLKVLGVMHFSNTCCNLPTPKPNPCCQPPPPYCKDSKGGLIPCPYFFKFFKARYVYHV